MAVPKSRGGRAIAIWAIVGVLGLLSQAIYRLLPIALEPWTDGSLSSGSHGPWPIVAYIASVLVMGYSEGYRGFQGSFSPRAVVRAFALAQRPTPLLIVFAPLVAMGLIHATRRRLIGSWVLLTGIVGLILAVRMLDQPWRGAVDAGVVVGLAWGITATAVFFVRGLVFGDPPDVPSQMPEG